MSLPLVPGDWNVLSKTPTVNSIVAICYYRFGAWSGSTENPVSLADEHYNMLQSHAPV